MAGGTALKRGKVALLVLGAVLATGAAGIGTQMAPDLLPGNGKYSFAALLPFIGVTVGSGVLGVLAGYLSWLLFSRDGGGSSAPAKKPARGVARFWEVVRKNRRLGVTGMVIGLAGVTCGLMLAPVVFPAQAVRNCIVLRVGSSLGPVSARLKEMFEATKPEVDHRCVRVELTEAPSGAPHDGIVRDDRAVHVWWPSSSMFVDRLKADSGAGVKLDSTPMTKSPLVIAMPRSAAKRIGWPERQLSWTDVIRWVSSTDAWQRESASTMPFRLARANPLHSPSGLATTTMLLSAGGARGEDGSVVEQAKLANPQVSATFWNVEKNLVVNQESSTQLLRELAKVTEEPRGAESAFTAIGIEEQSILDYNEGRISGQGKKPSDPLVAFYPTDQTVNFDHPLVVLRTPSTRPEETEAAGQFRDFMVHSDSVRQELTLAGYRDRDGNLNPALPVPSSGISNRYVENSQVVNAREVGVVLRQWQQVRRPASALVLGDASPTLAYQVAGDLTGQAVETDLAEGFVGQAREDDRVGLWSYSTQGRPGTKPVVAVPFGQADGVRKKQLADAAATLSTGQGTTTKVSLFDAILAAKQELQRWQRRPDETPAIVAFTSSADSSSGISLDQLLPEFQSPEGPWVRVIVVPVGAAQDGPQDAFTKIADASHGAVIPASKATSEAIMSAVLSYG